MKTEFILLPDNSDDLRKIYDHAIKNSKSLLIASAFLTDWPVAKELKEACKELDILVGVGFGLTRKKALKDCLNWLPARFKTQLFVSNSGSRFHPKVIAWQDKEDKYYALLGSSNLTYAGLSDNLEANVYTEINKSEWEKIRSWLHSEIKTSVLVNEGWIEDYKEADLKKFPDPKEPGIIDIKPTMKISKKGKEHLETHAQQMKEFNKIKKGYIELIKNCSKGKVIDLDFYEKMYDLRVYNGTIFQAPTWRITCKKSKWNKVCGVLVEVFDLEKELGGIKINNEFRFDNVVKSKLDMLDKKSRKEPAHPARKAWLTEQLCQFYPKFYPLWNNALDIWLKNESYQYPRGASFGSKYIHLARTFRKAIREKGSVIKDFAQLDAVAWTYAEKVKAKS